jgi:general secretion pathway protein E
MLIGQILLNAGKVTGAELEEALNRQRNGDGGGHRIGEILRRAGVISESDLLEALALQYGLDFLDSVPDDALDPELVEELPVEWARAHRVLPIRLLKGVRVVVDDPTRIEVLQDLALLLREEPVPILAPRDQIARAIERCYVRRNASASEFLDRMEDGEGEEGVIVVASSDDLLRSADQAPVTQLVNLILLEAVKGRASDIHIEPFEDHLHVRYRVDGVLYDQATPPKHLEAALVSRLKVMGRLDIAEKRLPQDGMARVRVGDQEIDVRVSTIPVAQGERVVLRLLSRESALLPLRALGMPEAINRIASTLLHEPNGILLVTGPTGSGKTTTLYAALNELDTRGRNILTIEDPVEYQIPGIGQMQVKPKIGLTFANGLRHILRQDPDVIMVGEIRDLETAEIVVRASMTGHLVFSTLHTNDAVSAVLRMVDMGIPPYLLAAAIRASLAQRLVRRLCPACRREVKVTGAMVEGMGPELKGLEGESAWEAGGCAECLGGYLGRTGIYELMTVSPTIREAIRTGASTDEIRRQAVAGGMSTLLFDGAAKVRRGETSIAELRQAAGHL